MTRPPVPTSDADRAATARSRLVALIVASAFFMQALDSTIITTALPKMAQSFHIAPSQLSLGITSYMLALAAFLPISGWMADRFGARNVFMAAIVVFTAASVACGQAHDLWTFTAARVVQGMGGALMGPVGRLVVLRNTEKKDMLQAIGTITWPALIAPVLGPYLGGIIVTYAAWPWIFLVNVPLGLVGLGLVSVFIPNVRSDGGTRFDTVGFLMVSACLVLIVGGLEAVSHSPSPWAPAAAVVAGVVLGWAAVRRFATHPEPLIELSAMKVKTFALTNLWGGGMLRMTVAATPFLLPLMFQLGLGYSPIRSGLLILAYFAGNLAMKLVTTPVLRRFGFRRTLIVNGVVSSLAIGACALFGAATPQAVMAAVLAVAGLSRSMQFTALNTLTFADITPQQHSAAATLSGVTQQLAQVFGVAGGALLLNGVVALHHAHQPALVDFRWAFAAMGLLSLLSVGSLLPLHSDAGAEVTRRAG